MKKSSLLFIVAFAFINWFNQKTEPNENILKNKAVYQFMSVVIPAIFLVSLYNTFRIEIVNYWDNLFISEFQHVFSKRIVTLANSLCRINDEIKLSKPSAISAGVESNIDKLKKEGFMRWPK